MYYPAKQSVLLFLFCLILLCPQNLFAGDEWRPVTPIELQAKTPQVGMKKGANNFFNRPPTGKKKEGRESNDLAALILIKPSVLEAPQKIEKVIVKIQFQSKRLSNSERRDNP